MRINYDRIISIIRDHFVELLMDDEYNSYYGEYQVKVSRERQFIERDIKTNNYTEDVKKTIYICVKFNSASVYYGQTVLPCTITALSEYNNISVCQDLLSDFACKFNLGEFVGNIQEIYQAPENVLEYNEMWNGFRDIFSMGATFIISDGIAFEKLTYFYKDGEETKSEDVPFISRGFNYGVSMDSVANYSSKNFTQAVSKIGTVSVSGSMYMNANSRLVKDCMKIIALASEDSTDVNNSIDNSFDMKVEFTQGLPSVHCKFKLMTFTVSEDLGELPVLQIGFSK